MEVNQSVALINKISGKNKVALEVLTKVHTLTPNYGTVVVMALQKYNVIGDNIEKMYVTCCEKDLGAFLMVVNRFLEGKYTEAQIHEKIQKGQPFEV